MKWPLITRKHHERCLEKQSAAVLQATQRATRSATDLANIQLADCQREKMLMSSARQMERSTFEARLLYVNQELEATRKLHEKQLDALNKKLTRTRSLLRARPKKGAR